MNPDRNLDRIYAAHPDHLATGMATLDAVYPGRAQPLGAPRAADEGLEPHTVDEVWLDAGAPQPTHYTRHHRRGRPQDRGAAVAQEPDARPGRDRDDGAELGSRRTRRVAGLPEGRFAEIVRVVNTR